jgi:PAS domain S-box-containing protein
MADGDAAPPADAVGETDPSVDRFRAIFEQVPLGVALIDPLTGRVHDANPRFAEILGRTSAAMTAIDWMAFSHPDDLQTDLDNMALLNAGSIPGFSMDKRCLRPDGSSIWVNTTVTPMVVTDHSRRQLLCTLKDVGERKRVEDALRDSERRFHEMFDSASDALFLIAADTGQIVQANSVASELYGYDHDELLTMKNVDVSAEPEETSRLTRERQVMAANEVTTIPRRLHRRKDGTVFPTEITARTLSMEGRSVLVVAVRDTSERVRAEEEIRRLNAELEERIVSRTEQRDAVTRELEAFAYSVSHDVRAPLRAIDGFAAMVLADDGAALSPASAALLERAGEAAQRMMRLLDDVLGLTRVSTRDLHRQSVDLSGLALEVAEELRAGQPQRVVEFVVEPDLSVSADLALTGLILRELLANAWKFTGRRDRARVEVGALDTGDEHAFYVRDDGAGFDMRYADHLFGAFQRMHTSEEFDGDGIGLATVQRIVRRHGGRVWAEAEVDKGATFFFTLPEPATSA